MTGIQSKVPNLTLNSLYLDDGILMGSPNDLAAALNIIQSDGPPQGLLLNRSKSLIYSPLNEANSPVDLPPDIPSISERFVLLGSPIGPPSFCEEVLHSRIEKLKDAVNRLSDLEDSYLQTTLLHSCLSLPSFPLFFGHVLPITSPMPPECLTTLSKSVRDHSQWFNLHMVLAEGNPP